MERMVSGGLGLQLELAQQGKAGMLVPQSISLLPAPCAPDTGRQQQPMTAAAKQRHMAEQRWQANKLSEKAKAHKLHELQALAARPEASAASDEIQRPLQRNQHGEPSRAAAEVADSGPLVQGHLVQGQVQQQPGTAAADQAVHRPTHFPDAVVSGYDQVVWTHWTGRYQTLKGQFCFEFL